MACCVLTAYFMSRLLKACEFLDLDIIKIQYNDFHDGPDDAKIHPIDHEQRLVTSKVSIEGMTCAACVSSIEQAVSTLDGVERVSISLHLSRATIVHQSRLDLDEILMTIEHRGYGAKMGERTAQQNLELLQGNTEIESMRRSFLGAVFLSSITSGMESLLWFSVPSKGVLAIRIATAVLAIWIQIADAKVIHSNAWRAAQGLSLTMDTLVSLSLSLGVALSLFNAALFGLETSRVYWSSVSFLTTVVVGGRLFDLILRKQSSATLASLYELQQKSILVKLRTQDRNGVWCMQYLDAAALQPGDEIEIGTATLVPCDCYVLEGVTSVEQSNVTGESIPMRKKPGDLLMSGTQNLSNSIVAVVYKNQEESTLASLISSISTSSEKSMLNDKAELAITRFVLVILVLALTGFCLDLKHTVTSGALVSIAINAGSERAMAILASACPCALGLAAPSATMAGLDACRLRGVVVKQGLETFQSMSRLTHVVMDKTGTLTTGKLSVANVEANLSEENLALICVAERDLAQYHPVAQALFQWSFLMLSEETRRTVGRAKTITSSNPAGNGIKVKVQSTANSLRSVTVHLGSEKFFLQNGIQSEQPVKQDFEKGDAIVVHLAIDQQYLTTIRLRDTIRREALSVITYLTRKLGLNLSLLTGDTDNEAQRVSKYLDIANVTSQMLPAGKRLFIERLQAQSSTNCVAMFGDGLNDASALSQADVGICLSLNTSGAASVSEKTNSQISEVIFTSPDLRRLPETLEIARKTVGQCRWNMRWALIYNIIAVALAFGVAEPIGFKVDAARAGTMMALSSISVLLWSLWLRYDLSKVSFQPP